MAPVTARQQDRVSPGRPGFTLVEMLVAMALIVFIMAILSQAFAAAAKTFHDLKAAGDLAERLRLVTSRLQTELAADHFNDPANRHLSDANFWTVGPPTQGYFAIYQQQISGQTLDYTNEGTQVSNSLPSTSSTNHSLCFTVNHLLPSLLKPQPQPGPQLWTDFFSTNCPSLDQNATAFGNNDSRYETPSAIGPPPTYTIYNSPAAEVAIFLQPSGNTTQDPTNPQPLFNLFHRTRLTLPGPPPVTPGPNTVTSSANNNENALYPEVSCGDPSSTGTLTFNTMQDLTTPVKRFGHPNPFPATANAFSPLSGPGVSGTALQNADLLLTNVLSFEVRMLFANPNGAAGANAAPAQPFMTLWDTPVMTVFPQGNNPKIPANMRIFDTWDKVTFTTWNSPTPTPGSVPLWNTSLNGGLGGGPIIQAIQITIRIYDPRSQMTRQSTIVQAM